MKQNFKRCVYEVVKRIPRGQVMSYREVAKKAGKPRAWRAVGNILNRHQELILPCHRVIRSDGKIGGYFRGTNKKIKLLISEGLKIKKNKIV